MSIKDILKETKLSEKSKERTKDIKLTLDVNIPNHDEELNNIKNNLNLIKEDIQYYKNINNLPNKIFYTLYEDIAKNLMFLAELSKPLFDLQDHIENFYFNEFKKSPALAKELYLNHYSLIHYKYNLNKNRCYKLFDDLDKLYIKINNMKPPTI